MSHTKHSFVNKVQDLVATAKKISQSTSLGGKPEDATRDRLIDPFLTALGYSSDYRTVEARIPSLTGTMGWVDYFLGGTNTSSPLMMLEAKSILDDGIWEKNKKQVLRYLRDYLLTVETAEQAIQWIIVTNFREWHFVKLGDREPFWSFEIDDLQKEKFASQVYEKLARSEFSRGQLEDYHSEREKTELGDRFLRDLKIWRLIIANGFNEANPKLSLEKTATASQRILNRFLFIRILEAYGRERFYSLGNLHHYWKRSFRNRPFLEQIQIKFRDTWASYNTELFDKSWIDNLDIGNEFLEPVILPDVYPSGSLADSINVHLQTEGYKSIYNYDFTTLTHDVLGVAYEQFLAHDLQYSGDGIDITQDNQTRKREGIYYTPDYVVENMVENSLDPVVSSLIEQAKVLLEEEEFQKAAEKIEQVFELRILDPACGSGTFLLKVFDHVLECIEEYNAKARELKEGIWENAKTGNGGFANLMDQSAPRVFNNAAERIVVEMIRGVDLDQQAVSLAKLSLWTRLLRNAPGKYGDGNTESRKLPALKLNIRHGNSLIGNEAGLKSGFTKERKEAEELINEVRNSDGSERNIVKAVDEFEGLLHSVKESLSEEILPLFVSDDILEAAVRKACDDEEAANDLLMSTSYEDLRSRLASSRNGKSQNSYSPDEDHALFLADVEDALVGDAQAISEIRSRYPFHWEIEFPDVFSTEVDPENRGFDLVIGNPPYYNVDSRFGRGAPELRWLKYSYPNSYTDKTDVLFYFLEKGTRLLLKDGVLSYIVSRAFLQADKAKGLREFLAQNTKIDRLLDFLGNKVFEAGIATAIIQISKKEREESHSFTACSVLNLDVVKKHFTNSEPLADLGDDEIRCVEVSQSDLGSETWSFGPFEGIFKVIDQNSKQLGELDGIRIGQGIQTGANDAFIGDFKGEFPENRIHPRISNSRIKSYEIIPSAEKLLYIDNSDEFEDLSKLIQRHLQKHEEQLRGRAAFEEGSCRWYSLHRPRVGKDKHHFVSKILCPYRAPENRFAVDPAGKLAGTQDTTAIYVDSDEPDWIYALCALLNSKVLNFRYRALGGIGKLTGKGMFEYFENQIRKLPIPLKDRHPDEFDALSALGKEVHNLTELRREICKEAINRAKSTISTDTTLGEYADVAGPYSDIVRWKSPNAKYDGHLKELRVEATHDGFVIRGLSTQDPDWREAEYEWINVAEFEILHEPLRRYLLASTLYTVEFDEGISRKHKLTGSDPENIVTATFKTVYCPRFDGEKQRNLLIMERLLDRIEEDKGRSNLENVMIDLIEKRSKIDTISSRIYDVQQYADTIRKALEVVL